MKSTRHWIAAFLLAQLAPVFPAQAPGQTSAPVPQSDARYRQIEERLDTLSSALDRTRGELASALDEIQRLRKELERTQSGKNLETPAENGAARLAEDVARIREDQDALQEQIKVHEQAKVETASRYHVWLNGLVLFNLYANRGTVDTPDLANVALATSAETYRNLTGASIRQTILGLNASGPHVLGARSSGDLTIDFFANQDRETPVAASGNARVRTAHFSLEWPHDRVEFGNTAPLISPLSPTSYAAVAEPSMIWAGNLSAWAPQVKFDHQIKVRGTNRLGLEIGLWNGVYGGSNLYIYQALPSAVESVKWPGVESRISWTSGSEAPFHLGLGGYRGALKTAYGKTVPSWAVTADMEVWLRERLSLSGEIYRGTALAGLGGGSHKDILIGTDPSTGVEKSIGLNAVGGWTQFKLKLAPAAEFNATIGGDSGYGSDFRNLTLAFTNNPVSTLARNRMIAGNLVYHPKTYLILSPEYRRIFSWQISGASNVANIFTLSAGYSF